MIVSLYASQAGGRDQRPGGFRLHDIVMSLNDAVGSQIENASGRERIAGAFREKIAVGGFRRVARAIAAEGAINIIGITERTRILPEDSGSDGIVEAQGFIVQAMGNQYRTLAFPSADDIAEASRLMGG